MVMNVHLLKHLPHSVRNSGPLWSQSVFSFEQNNGCLLKFVNGTSDVLRQISSKYVLKKSIEKNTEPKSKHEITMNFFGKGQNVVENAGMFLLAETCDIYRFPWVKLKVFKRMKMNSIVYTSSLYTRPKKSIDFFIGYCKSKIGIAKYYFEFEGKIFAMVNEYKIVEKFDHILCVQSTKRLIVCKVESINVKYLYMTVNKEYIVLAPNRYEIE